MDKVFSYNEDIDKTAYMNWRTRQHQPIHDMTIIADGYMKAAVMLAEDCLRDNKDKKADIVVFHICCISCPPQKASFSSSNIFNDQLMAFKYNSIA